MGEREGPCHSSELKRCSSPDSARLSDREGEVVLNFFVILERATRVSRIQSALPQDNRFRIPDSTADGPHPSFHNLFRLSFWA
jgi:hypothetical protein